MRAPLIALLVACGSNGGGSTVSSTPPTPQPTPNLVLPGRMRVMTYNVNFGGRGDRAGVEAVASASPDIVLFQETTPEWESALVAGLGARLAHHHFEDTQGNWAAGGMGVMARWPISKVERLDGGEPFYAHRVIVETPRGPIQLLNLHLRPPMSESGSWVVGFFSTREIREREAKRHVARLDRSLPTIIAGDFNEEDDGLGMAVFRAAGFTNTLPQFHPDAPTWQWPLSRDMALRFRLDHVMVDGRFRAVDGNVVTAGISDHYPVWVDLERR
jgi:endonuclease/exonuclease/phosphatase family metal-dependent hydrolase